MEITSKSYEKSKRTKQILTKQNRASTKTLKSFNVAGPRSDEK